MDPQCAFVTISDKSKEGFCLEHDRPSPTSPSHFTAKDWDVRGHGSQVLHAFVTLSCSCSPIFLIRGRDTSRGVGEARQGVRTSLEPSTSFKTLVLTTVPLTDL